MFFGMRGTCRPRLSRSVFCAGFGEVELFGLDDCGDMCEKIEFQNLKLLEAVYINAP